MTINERVSPKRLAEIIARAEVCDDSVLTDYRDIESIARELQQYRAAAEPVCPKCGGTGMADSGGVQPWGEPIFIECDCHAAPQLPLPAVVPDAIEIDDDFDSAFEHGKAVGWNACRAAMLQGKAEPVSQPYTLPLDYLQGYKDGCEWSALMAEANHPQTGDWLFDDPIELAKAIRKGPDMLPAEPVNSAAIPDGWIPVSERMPELDTRVLLYFHDYGGHIEDGCIGDEGDGPYHYFFDGDSLSHEPTHWMSLPAAPKQK